MNFKYRLQHSLFYERSTSFLRFSAEAEEIPERCYHDQVHVPLLHRTIPTQVNQLIKRAVPLSVPRESSAALSAYREQCRSQCLQTAMPLSVPREISASLSAYRDQCRSPCLERSVPLSVPTETSAALSS